jgi:hypothetical protein
MLAFALSAYGAGFTLRDDRFVAVFLKGTRTWPCYRGTLAVVAEGEALVPRSGLKSAGFVTSEHNVETSNAHGMPS